MKRLFWVALGATAGVLVVRKITQAADSLTPEGAADRVAGGVRELTAAIRDFADEVRAGMTERDAELRYALGIAPDGTGATGKPGHPDLDAVDDLIRTNPRGTY
ncbi:DUF6167 family protein [Jiangella gansuensis]|uniref:DUF6167 family protein n=1 Tax=Jiangella gansuensis TaxID=281473 RepID=UPI0004B44D40|nr:DUF6167 family protein [Jiangella gansuensis]